MKVAYLLGSLNRGGTETLLLDVFKSADCAPFGIVGIHRKGGVYKDDFYQTSPRMLQCAPRKFGLLRYLRKLRMSLQNEGVSIVHAQQSIDSMYASLATIGTGIKVVETFHGFDFGTNKVGRLINRLSIRWADAVCFVSNTQKDYYIAHYRLQKLADKLHVVYNGVDFSKLDVNYPIPDFLSKIDSATAENKEDHAATKSDSSIPAAKRRIRLAMVGNFVRVRAQSVVCRSIQLLREQGITNFDFYFVGKRDANEPWRYDDCVRYCEQHGLNNVHFTGGRGDVPAILQHIDAFVYSTDHDTFGIAVVEAMAAGLPVIVNDWSVMCEVINRGEQSGYTLWQTGNPNSLADMLSDYLGAPERYERQALGAKPKIREAFSIEQHIKRLSEVYNSLA